MWLVTAGRRQPDGPRSVRVGIRAAIVGRTPFASFFRFVLAEPKFNYLSLSY
jgi:hypothetical protein